MNARDAWPAFGWAAGSRPAPRSRPTLRLHRLHRLHRTPQLRLAALPTALAALTVGLQVPYPLAAGEARQTLTLLSVLSFAAASASHAALRRGVGWTAGYLVVAVGGGLLAETVGVRTGWPFGRYAYADTLGPTVAGVPAVVPLAWAMATYPVLVFSQYALGHPAKDTGRARLSRLAATAVFGGLLLAAWDLFLDPQMVDEGHWYWIGDVPSLNGIPLSNSAGWLLVGTCLTGLLAILPANVADPRAGDYPASDRQASDYPASDHRVGNDPGGSDLPDDTVAFVLLGWTYFSSVLANLVFFGRPAVALTGGAAVGILLVAGVWWHPRRARREQTAQREQTARREQTAQ